MPLKILQSSGCADRFNRLQETTKHVDQGNHTVDGFKKQLLFSFSLFPGSMSVLYLICDLVLDSIALPGPAHRKDPWVPFHRNLRMAWSLLSHQQMQRPGSFQDCRNSTMTMGRSCLELQIAVWIWEWIWAPEMFPSWILCLPGCRQDHFVLRQVAFSCLVGDANQAESQETTTCARPVKAILLVWCPRLVTLHVHSLTSFICGILRMNDNLG